MKGRKELKRKAQELPPYTRECLLKKMELLDEIEERIQQIEGQIKSIMTETPEINLLRTIPGISFILALVMAAEIGDIERFTGPEKMVSYAGIVPRVKSSGGKVFYGPVRPDVNRYLKWAFIEAANTVVIFHKKWIDKHAARLYFRLRSKKGHSKAVVAVARHLAEAAYWILKKKEPYREMTRNQFRPPRSKRDCSPESLSLENWVQNFWGTCSCHYNGAYMHLTKRRNEQRTIMVLKKGGT